jgi:hypothetical protein
MKAKDLTQADVGKWVTLRGKITDVDKLVKIEIEGDLDDDGDQDWAAINLGTTLEFTEPPAPVQEVGDVFKNTVGNDWTLVAIVDGVCLLTTECNHMSQTYPLHQGWTLVRKGTNP